MLAVGGSVVAVAQTEVGERYVSPLFDRGERAAGVSDLVVMYDWPTLRGCDAGTQVAMPAGGATPEDVNVRADADARHDVIAAGGAAWGYGHLNLYLSARLDKVVHVVGLEVVRFRQSDTRPGWILDVQGGCGDGYERVFEVSLDQPRPALVDIGAAGEEAAAQEEPKTEPLGPTFTVSATDPAHVRVDVSACAAYHEWGLRITYLVDGVRRTYTLGSSEHPLRSIGGTSDNWYAKGDRRLDRLPSPATKGCSDGRGFAADTVERFLLDFLAAWWKGDDDAIADHATADALAHVRADLPGTWTGYRLEWDPMTCVMGTAGVGGCDVTFMSSAGERASYGITYHERNRFGDLVVVKVERR